jgi:hypothetical protein
MASLDRTEPSLYTRLGGYDAMPDREKGEVVAFLATLEPEIVQP